MLFCPQRRSFVRNAKIQNFRAKCKSLDENPFTFSFIDLDVRELLCIFAGKSMWFMNIDGLVKKYFQGQNPTIEVFDEQSIHQVYSNVVNLLKACPDIELGVLQLLSYCFYEILDNVVTHSGKNCGTVISQYLSEGKTIRLLIVDEGVGIRASLSENEAYKEIAEDEALRKFVVM